MFEAGLAKIVKRFINKNKDSLQEMFWFDCVDVIDNQRYFLDGWGSNSGSDFIADVIEKATGGDM